MAIHLNTICSNTHILTPSETTADDIAAIALHFEPAYLQENQLVKATAFGRGPVYFFTWQQHSWVLRHYLRGGLVAKLNRDHYLFTGLLNTRAYQELSVLSHLSEHGLKVPKPLAARLVRRGLWYQADIITQTIENAQELHTLLSKHPIESSLWQKIGRSIRKMHDLQCCHYDLNVKNILIQGLGSQSSTANEEEVFLLDFDAAKIIPASNKDGNKTWKAENLARFKRSLYKQVKLAKISQQAYHFTEQDWEHVREAYQASRI